jgi:hypothetical protein
MNLRWVRAATHTPSALLLSLQLIAVLAYPFLEGDRTKRSLFSLVALVVLLLVVYTLHHSPAATWVGLTLATPVLVLLVVQLATDADGLTAWIAGFAAALYAYAAYALVRYMFQDRVITTDELFAVGATFTLLAWAFAYTYVVVQEVAPHSFTASSDPQAPRTWVQLLSMSFTNLTAVGAGDINPVRPFARSVVMIEQVVGVLYLAMVVTVVVGLTVARLRGDLRGGTAGDGSRHLREDGPAEGA